MGESVEWRPVVGLESTYEVSEHGAVRRTVAGPNTYAGRLLTPRTDRRQYFWVNLPNPRMARVHRLVALAWHPNPDGHPLVRHLDGNPQNNHYSNLAWGTFQQNADDRVAHGRSRGHWTNRTHCKNGHAYDDVGFYVTRRPGGTARVCKPCNKAYQAKRRSKPGAVAT